MSTMTSSAARILSSKTLSALALVALAPSATAQLASYSQTFEGLNAADTSALANDGWLVTGNVYDPSGNFIYNYGGVFPAPNNGQAFSVVGGGLGGPQQGNQYIVAFSDYNNVAEHQNGNTVESFVFQEQVIDASNVGETWTFEFDHLQDPAMNNPGMTTTEVFVKVLQQSNGSFAELAADRFDSTNISTTTWGTTSLSLTIDPAWAGELLQFGFSSRATAFWDSGRFYDNLSWSAPGAQQPGLEGYDQDFEALDIMDPDALTNDGWLIFANVFDPSSNFLYGYGVFGAPNGSGGFSNVASGFGGPPQQAQHLDVFSDYNNTDHGVGNLIDALVFQEQPIAPQDSGETWTFGFDYRQNPNNTASGTTTRAFVKVVQTSNMSFVELFNAEFDTTGASLSTWDRGEIDVVIDPSWAGETIQFGFASVATNFEPSSRLYDNVFWNATGIGTPYCQVNPNSTGLPASLIGGGSADALENDFVLIAGDLPPNQFGFFVNSTQMGFVPNIGTNGSGNLCLSGAIGRFNRPGEILFSGAAGRFDLVVDLTEVPRSSNTVSVMAGETYFFQAWFRDINALGQSSNLTNGLEVTFE